jgi:outer membrane protein assembly factor BamC
MRLNMRLLLALLMLTLLSACSTTKDEQLLNYRTSEITPTLEIPPDLTQVSGEDNLNIPGSKVGLPENAGRYVETGNLNVELRTLPRVEGIHLQGHGDAHWLVVPESAEKLYPLLRRFWAEQGFQLLKDEPAAGVMETEWLTSRATGGSFLSSILESMKGSDFKDQYLTRLERGDEAGNSLVYIAHHGQEFFLHDATKQTVSTDRSSGWQMVPSDPNKEYEMTSRLMLFLGMQDDQVKQEMEKIGLFAPLTRIQVDEAKEVSYLVVAQSFEQTWNRLQLYLDRLNVPVIERDKAQNDGRLKVSMSTLLGNTDKADEDKSKQIYLALEGGENENQALIYVEDSGGTVQKSEQGRDVLQYLQKLLK